MKPVGFQQITAPSTRTLLTVPAGARYALVQVEKQNVRWRDDTVAVTTVGMLLGAGKDMLYDGDLATIEFIQEASTAVINVSYFAHGST